MIGDKHHLLFQVGKLGMLAKLPDILLTKKRSVEKPFSGHVVNNTMGRLIASGSLPLVEQMQWYAQQ